MSVPLRYPLRSFTYNTKKSLGPYEEILKGALNVKEVIWNPNAKECSYDLTYDKELHQEFLKRDAERKKRFKNKNYGRQD